MDLGRRLDLRLLAARGALRLLVVLMLLVAMTYGVAQAARSATHEGRCGDLLANQYRSDYIGAMSWPLWRTATGMLRASLSPTRRSGFESGFRPVRPLLCAETVEALEPSAVDGCREVENDEVRVQSDRAAVARVSGPQGDVRVGLINIDGSWLLRTPPCGPGIPA